MSRGHLVDGRRWRVPRRSLAVSFLLAALTAALFLPVRNFPFLLYDDSGYVTDNPEVLAGLSWPGAAWAFTEVGRAGNWHPLTWLSHMLDIQLFGLRSGAHHLMSAALHLATTLVLFLVLRRMTGALWRSAAVAALFAAHPLHVESVAWVAERKDVLSGFLGALALASYLRYARRPGAASYLAVVVAFALGLMAKATLVTLPFLLLLLDCWPLGRLRSPGALTSLRCGPSYLGGSPALSLLLEKAPLIALSAGTAVLTYVAQERSRSVASFGSLGAAFPAANALTSIAAYAGKALWPADLAVLYPYPTAHHHLAAITATALLLAAVTALAFRARTARPYFLIGWLWFLGTLVPVIGIVQVGVQAMADRYTYLPLVGLFVTAAWGTGDLAARAGRRGSLRPGIAAAAAVAIGAFFSVAIVQVGLWRDDVTLFRHAVQVTRENWVAEDLLGLALFKRGETGEALAHLRKSVEINPRYARSRANLSAVLERLGLFDEQIAQSTEALRLDPRQADMHYNLGVALTRRNRRAEAIRHYREALRIEPGMADAHTNLALLLKAQGNLAEAEALLARALRLNPRDELAHLGLGSILLGRGARETAAAHFQTALALRPDLVEARRGLESARLTLP